MTKATSLFVFFNKERKEKEKRRKMMLLPRHSKHLLISKGPIKFRILILINSIWTRCPSKEALQALWACGTVH